MDKRNLIKGVWRASAAVGAPVLLLLSLTCVTNPFPAAELEAAVSTGFPDVLSGKGRCNAPLLVDWLVDTAFTQEDEQPPAVPGKGWVPPCSPWFQLCTVRQTASIR